MSSAITKKNTMVTRQDKQSPELLELTEQQKSFVLCFTRGETAGQAGKSAIKAGYSQKTAPSMVSALMRHPKIQAAIDAEVRAEIGGALTVCAVRVISQIITDENAPLRLRGDMAAKVIEYSGVIDRTKEERAQFTGLNGSSTGPKRLAEMTREELEKLVQGGAAILQAAAAMPKPGPLIEGSAQVSAQLTKEAAE